MIVRLGFLLPTQNPQAALGAFMKFSRRMALPRCHAPMQRCYLILLALCRNSWRLVSSQLIHQVR